MTEDERRRFFRINDQVAITFSKIEEGYGGASTDEEVQDLNQEFHVSLEMQIRQAMVDIRSQSPKVAQVLDLMNQKINLLRSSEMLAEGEPVLKDANLSACGIAFAWHESLPINQNLALNLYLQPKHELIRCSAHVAGVESNHDAKNKEDGFIIRLDFDEIHDAYQELLIQHVVQRQGHQLRKKMEE